MSEIQCFDLNGNSITHLTQWDTNQSLYIDWEYDVVPIFHFCNIKSEYALVVKGEIINGKAKSDIPNILLQQPHTIAVFAYLEEGDIEIGDAGTFPSASNVSGRSVYTFEIPVRKKPKPQNYQWKENIEYVSWIKLEAEARAFLEQLEADKNEFEQTLGTAKENADKAANSANEAKISETNAAESAANAALSEANAKVSEENAAASARAASEDADRAEACADSIDTSVIELKIATKGDNLYLDNETSLLYLTSEGKPISDGISIPNEGGSIGGVITKLSEDGVLYHVAIGTSGSGSNADLQYTMKLKNLLEERIIEVVSGSAAQLVFSYSSVDSDGIGDGNGIGKIIVDNEEVETFSVAQGTNTLDITEYIVGAAGSVKEHPVSIRVENSEGMYRMLTYVAVLQQT